MDLAEKLLAFSERLERALKFRDAFNTLCGGQLRTGIVVGLARVLPVSCVRDMETWLRFSVPADGCLSKGPAPEVLAKAVFGAPGWRPCVFFWGSPELVVEAEPGAWIFDHKDKWFKVLKVPKEDSNDFRGFLSNPSRLNLAFLKWDSLPVAAFRVSERRLTFAEFDLEHRFREDHAFIFVEVSARGQAKVIGDLFRRILREIADPRLGKVSVRIKARNMELEKVIELAHRWAAEWGMICRRTGYEIFTLYPPNLQEWLETWPRSRGRLKPLPRFA